jgi:hypothetical protein
LVLSLGRWYRECEEKAPRTVEFEVCSLHVTPSNGPNLCIYVLGPHQGATVVFGYIEGSFLVSRTDDVCEHYVPNIYRDILGVCILCVCDNRSPGVGNGVSTILSQTLLLS